jgi:hypothetical protein
MAARIRRFRIKGDPTRFDIFGLGWNKEKMRRAAEIIRSNGYYARVIPSGFDKTMNLQRYAIFYSPKTAITKKYNGGEKGIGLSPNGWNWIRKNSSKVDHRKLTPRNQMLPQSPSTWIFNRKLDGSFNEKEWDKSIAESDEAFGEKLTILDKMIAKRLDLSVERYVDQREFGESEALEEEESQDDYEEPWWEKEGMYYDPLERFTTGTISDLEARGKASVEARKEEKESNNLTVATAETVEDEEEPEGYEEGMNTGPDKWSEMMDFVGYNDSVWRGLSPHVLMGYQGSVYEEHVLDEKEYEGLLAKAEEHKKKSQKDAELFFSGAGRFSDFAKYAERLGAPKEKDIIALPVVSLRYWDEDKQDLQYPADDDGQTRSAALRANTIGSWYLHPKVQETLFDLHYGTGAKDSVFAAEMAMLQYVFSGGGGYQEFSNAVTWNDDMLGERIEENILNMGDWELDSEPEVIVVGTDIGFFDSRGGQLGIRVTPDTDEEVGWDPFGESISGTKFPPFIESLFRGQEDWNTSAVSQVYWRHRRIYGDNDPTKGEVREWPDETFFNLKNDLLYELSPAEIAGIYLGHTRDITKAEAQNYLNRFETYGPDYEDSQGIDYRLYENQDFLQEVKDKLSLKKKEFAKKYKLSRWEENAMTWK